MSTNVKSQIKLLLITLAQTIVSGAAIASFAPIIGAWKTGWENDPIWLKISLTVCWFLLITAPLYLLSYIPAKYAMAMKGALLGNTTVDSVYYNTTENKVKIKTFTDFAEYKPKYTLIWTLLSPFAFLFQLVGLIMALIAPKTDRIYSKLGMKSYATLENPVLQEIYNFLFNFVVFPKSKEEKQPVAEEKSAPIVTEGTMVDEKTDGEDNIVTLKNADGEDVDFLEIAGIAYKGNFYAILQPVELIEGMDDDDALVFKVTKRADGENNFELELDDEINTAVFEEYNRLLDEHIANEQ